MRKIFVRNNLQIFIFDEFIRAQLSDGHWEEENTENLWRAKVEVGPAGQPVGVTHAVTAYIDCGEVEDVLLHLGVLEAVRKKFNVLFDAGHLRKELVDLTYILNRKVAPLTSEQLELLRVQKYIEHEYSTAHNIGHIIKGVRNEGYLNVSPNGRQWTTISVPTTAHARRIIAELEALISDMEEDHLCI